ncbi:hypothetical protein [Nostoc sp. TCL26-01]|nr:hypothetical protein [Nostoc sp. TCL26-01]
MWKGFPPEERHLLPSGNAKSEQVGHCRPPVCSSRETRPSNYLPNAVA